MKKLLILPSWYPSPEDKLNGSFFQEQAKLVSDEFDVKVLYVRWVQRPSTRHLLRKPLSTLSAWLRFALGKKMSRRALPNEEVFRNPPLIEYECRVAAVGKKRGVKKQIAAYLGAVEELRASGWVPDLMHAQSVYWGGLAAERIHALYGTPYVITEHMPFALGNYPKHVHDAIRMSYRNAESVLLLGEDQIRQFGMAEIEVGRNFVYNLVDEHVFCKMAAPYEPGTELSLVSIGAASHYKDYLTLLRALLVLRERGVPFQLTMIGLGLWGNRHADIRQFIAENDLSGSVKTIDRLDRREVNEYLSRCHVFVMTSLVETFCVSMIEAMASGLPVVTTAHGGGAVDLMTAETGVVVPVKDHVAIASVLASIYAGNLKFDPGTIRRQVLSVCGTESFGRRLKSHYLAALIRS